MSVWETPQLNSKLQWLICLRVDLSEAVVPGLGCCRMGEPFLGLVEGQERPEEWICQEVCEGGGKRLVSEKGKSVRTQDLTPPSQAIFSLHLCIPSPGCWLGAYPV